jgi:hypothetical protein
MSVHSFGCRLLFKFCGAPQVKTAEEGGLIACAAYILRVLSPTLRVLVGDTV